MGTSQPTARLCRYCQRPLKPLEIMGFAPPGIYEPCTCAEAVWERENDERERSEQEARERAAAKIKRYAKAGIEPKYLEATAPKELSAKVFSGQGLYLWGNSGCGKTWAASGIAKELVDRGTKVTMLSMGDLLRSIKATYSGNGSEEEIIERLMRSKVLIIDDLGAESLKDWSTSTVEAVFDKAEKRCKQLIVTSNYRNGGELGKHLAAGSDPIQAMRIVSRISGMTEAIDMSGPDRRLQ